MKSITLVLFFVLFTSAFCQAQIGFAITSKANRVTIPIEVVNNLIVVPVTLNGTLPLKFILDTGVKNTILTDRSFTDILDISYDRQLEIVGADGNVVDAYLAKNLTLDLPGVIGKGQAMIVLQEDYLQLRTHLGMDVHGIIGFEIFNRFIVEIDYENKKLVLHEPFKFKRKQFLKKIPIEIVRSKPFISADVEFSNGSRIKDCRLMMDTGASHSILFDQTEDQAIKRPEVFIETFLGRALGGEIQGSIGRIERLKFSKFKFDDVLVSFSETDLSDQASRINSRAGTIGGEIFSRFRIIIDYFNKEVSFARNRDYRKKFEFNMSGLEIAAKGKGLNDFYIYKVNENSPAYRSGIRPGDRLRYVNGMNASELKLSVINSFFRSRVGKKMKLKLERNNEIIVRKFKLEKII